MDHLAFACRHDCSSPHDRQGRCGQQRGWLNPWIPQILKGVSFGGR